MACNQTMQSYMQEAGRVYEQFGQYQQTMENALKEIGMANQKNEQILDEYRKQLTELKTTQAITNQTLTDIRRICSQLEMASSDGKQIILYPGLASRLSKESEQRIVDKVDSRIEESEAKQQAALEEIRRSIKKLGDPTQKKNKWFS